MVDIGPLCSCVVSEGGQILTGQQLGCLQWPFIHLHGQWTVDKQWVLGKHYITETMLTVTSFKSRFADNIEKGQNEKICSRSLKFFDSITFNENIYLISLIN